ncbi:MAG: class I SAM-dependent methyltransferase [Gammaproteobacteria bacterium]|nr:class I SAM-dependent methyltransferase [Gammaproteobacteria bacterium]NIR85380.1 class I SAM-dependent methyltransferase [Gammaproteobacteria bacterium]NIR88898.1 class I SAM-dependent methyltransferase [Gammaproteobacteria bacterium]NIU06506.1 class I SAM-dependent methyltransferase [Gammaproteobacteria bacterium]NIV53399.1 methyltransferase domain-containing protein [Gammaproteobacteria bacterium]
MRADIERWERKYARGNPNPEFAPTPLLVAYRRLLTGSGLALDVACGVGHNALYLAGLGFEVFAADGSLRALRYGREQARARGLSVHWLAVDLDRFRPPPGRFDLVLVVKFLDRDLVPALRRSLSPGGLMIYETFNVNALADKPDFNPAYALRRGELAELFQDFETIATNDSPTVREPLTHWIGRKPVR